MEFKLKKIYGYSKREALYYALSKIDKNLDE